MDLGEGRLFSITSKYGHMLRDTFTRICPGMYLAEDSVFLAIATILATFDITVGERQEKPVVQSDGFNRSVSTILPFEWMLKHAVATLVRSSAKSNLDRKRFGVWLWRSLKT